MNQPSSAPPTPTPRQQRLGLILLCAVAFIAVVNGNMVNVALPFIGHYFEVSEGTYGWLVTGFSLTFGVFSAVHGRLASRVGVRRLYALGVIVLGLTSILLALTPTIEIAIALRVLQGAGSAAMPTLATVILARLYVDEGRGTAMGWFLGAIGVAASIGPFLGGILVEIGGWRLVFASTSIVLFMTPLIFSILPEHLDRQDSRPFDLIGAILMGLGVTALLYAFNLLERLGPGLEVGLAVAAGLFLMALLLVWLPRQKDPFIDPDIFADPRYSLSALLAFLANAARFGTIVLVPIFLVEVNQVSPLVVGFVLFPGALAIALLSPLSGRIGDTRGARIPVTWGILLVIAGSLVTAATTGAHPVGPAVGMGLFGLGFAFIQSPLLSATTQILPERHAGTGTGVFMMIYFLGGGTGVALSVTAVELQARDATSWLDLVDPGGAIYSNAVLVLAVLGILSLLLTPAVPGLDPKPRASE